MPPGRSQSSPLNLDTFTRRQSSGRPGHNACINPSERGETSQVTGLLLVLSQHYLSAPVLLYPFNTCFILCPTYPCLPTNYCKLYLHQFQNDPSAFHCIGSELLGSVLTCHHARPNDFSLSWLQSGFFLRCRHEEDHEL